MMKKKTVLILAFCGFFCLTGCQKKAEEAPAEGMTSEVTPAAEVVIDESSEEFGSIEAENTEEETGEVMEEISIDCTLEADHDGLVVELGAGTEGYTWHYIISDEARMALESEYLEDRDNGKVQEYVFRAKQPGELDISFFYVESPDELEIPQGENPADYSDVTCHIRVAEDLTVELEE